MALFSAAIRRDSVSPLRIIFFRELFTPALADSFPLVFEWHQVSSSLQDYSQYSGRSQKRRNLDGLHPSSYFLVLHFFYQSFGDCTERTNYKGHNRHFHVP